MNNIYIPKTVIQYLLTALLHQKNHERNSYDLSTFDLLFESAKVKCSYGVPKFKPSRQIFFSHCKEKQ